MKAICRVTQTFYSDDSHAFNSIERAEAGVDRAVEDIVGVESGGGVGVEAGDHDSASTTAALCTAELGAGESRFWEGNK